MAKIPTDKKLLVIVQYGAMVNKSFVLKRYSETRQEYFSGFEDGYGVDGAWYNSIEEAIDQAYQTATEEIQRIKQFRKDNHIERW